MPVHRISPITCSILLWRTLDLEQQVVQQVQEAQQDHQGLNEGHPPPTAVDQLLEVQAMLAAPPCCLQLIRCCSFKLRRKRTPKMQQRQRLQQPRLQRQQLLLRPKQLQQLLNLLGPPAEAYWALLALEPWPASLALVWARQPWHHHYLLPRPLLLLHLHPSPVLPDHSQQHQDQVALHEHLQLVVEVLFQARLVVVAVQSPHLVYLQEAEPLGLQPLQVHH
jgi:hypothetical protein